MKSNIPTTALKVPTPEDYAAFSAEDCHKLWATLPEDWRCPACQRSKFELLAWEQLFDREGARACMHVKQVSWGLCLDRHHYYHDWYARVCRHHDHGTPERFPEAVVCHQCTEREAAAKRVLRLPEDFSFSPAEIGGFTTAPPHSGEGTVDYYKAQVIYEAATYIFPQLEGTRPLAPPR